MIPLINGEIGIQAIGDLIFHPLADDGTRIFATIGILQ